MGITRKNKSVVIFDGQCGACLALKHRAQAYDAEDNLDFLPSQSADLATISPTLTPEMASQALCFIRQDGAVFRGSRAVFEVMRQLPGAWGILGRIASLPGLSLFAEPIYQFFARHRHRISQRLGLTGK